MKSSALLREQIETSLSARMQGVLSPRLSPEPVRIACGNSAVDELLHGGITVGGLTEFVGDPGSGLTTTAVAYVSAITQTGSVCVWIDVSDSFDPETATANGVDLERLLWVRCGSQPQAYSQRKSEVNQSVSISTIPPASQPRHAGCGSPHPRSEGRDMPAAIDAMLHRQSGMSDLQVRRQSKAIGTPGMQNRPLTYNSQHREEQVNSDRLPPRRGDNLAIAPRSAEPQPRRNANVSAERQLLEPSAPHELSNKGNSLWNALDQALRATDLLLQSGGFSAIVLDLGSVRPEFAWRIPLATWFRFRAACERTRVSLILLTQHPCARSSAELVVRLQTGSMEAQGNVMTGIRYRAAVERSRSHEREERVIPIRKPPQSARPGEGVREAAWALRK